MYSLLPAKSCCWFVACVVFVGDCIFLVEQRSASEFERSSSLLSCFRAGSAMPENRADSDERDGVSVLW